MVSKRFFLDLMTFLTHINIRPNDFLKSIILCTTILCHPSPLPVLLLAGGLVTGTTFLKIYKRVLPQSEELDYWHPQVGHPHVWAQEDGLPADSQGGEHPSGQEPGGRDYSQSCGPGQGQYTVAQVLKCNQLSNQCCS